MNLFGHAKQTVISNIRLQILREIMQKTDAFCSKPVDLMVPLACRFPPVYDNYVK